MVVSSAILTRSNLFTQPHANLFNLINDKNNIPDPSSNLPSQQQEKKMVYTRFPDIHGQSFQGYPFIVIFPFDNDFYNYTLGRNKSLSTFTARVEIWSSERKRGFEGRGAEFLDTLSDYFVETLNNTLNQSILRNYSMANIKIETVSSDVLETENELIYRRIFNV